jgi:hypothetical protein
MRCSETKRIMDLYCTATGMKINLGKSTVSYMGVSEEDMRYFSQMFPYKKVNLQNGLNFEVSMVQNKTK